MSHHDHLGDSPHSLNRTRIINSGPISSEHRTSGPISSEHRTAAPTYAQLNSTTTHLNFDHHTSPFHRSSSLSDHFGSRSPSPMTTTILPVPQIVQPKSDQPDRLPGLCINRHYLTSEEHLLSEQLQSLRVTCPLQPSARSASISPVSSAAATPIPPGTGKKKNRRRRFNLRRLGRRSNKTASPVITAASLHSAHRPVSAQSSSSFVASTAVVGHVSGSRNSGKRKLTGAPSPHQPRNPLFRSLQQALSDGRLKSIHRFQLLLLNSGMLPIRKQTAAAILPQSPFDLSTDRYDAHLSLIRRYPVLVKAEFVQLERNEANLIQRQANRAENIGKNAHPRLLPFDCNRVLLQQIPDEPGSDYVNASHVDSLLRPNAYIAAAGPHEHTAGDFWRMVWDHKSYVVVMLTKVLDFIRVMCCQYWPLDANKPVIYDWMEVVLLAEEPLADFKIRTFRIRRLSYAEWLQNRRKLALEAQAAAAAAPNAPPPEPPGPRRPTPTEEEVQRAFERLRRGPSPIKTIKQQNGESKMTTADDCNDDVDDKFADWEQSGECRIVYQFHYENWPVHTCPYADSLLQFRRRVKVYTNELNSRLRDVGPMVVHCSDGCGRTGAFLVIDANIELAKEDNLYDIFGYAKALRASRKGMIESLDQYKFVYDCLEEAQLNGQTWFPLSELISKMKEKSVKDPETKLNQYQREYDKIVKLSPKFSIGDCAGGHRIENRAKNRDVSIIPPDSDRPYLSTFQNNDSTDFVNAVFIDGYTRPREYMVTEWPMAHTIPDCWSLIYDHDCNSVVVLANPDDHNKYPPFWPTEKEKKKKFGPVFTIECLAFNHYANIKSWMFKINKKVVSLTELMSNVSREPKTTKFFQITCWPTGHKVPSSTNALVELMDMVERWRQRTSYGPVCVISADGRGRAGVYCAANVAIEQVVQHGEVDVFQAVKTVRRHRPQLVENMTEYKYCYDVILHYVLHYLNHGT